MDALRFIDWLEGFLENKKTLTDTDVNTLKEKIQDVEKGEKDVEFPFPLSPPVPPPYYPPITIPNIPNPSVTGYGCQFPNDCGLPDIWHGVVPPICQKCGFQPNNNTITFTGSIDDSGISVDYTFKQINSEDDEPTHNID